MLRSFILAAAALVLVANVASAQDKVARGAAVYTEQKCQLCHSVAGKGNAKGPLDAVGTKLSARVPPLEVTLRPAHAVGLRDATTAAPPVRLSRDALAVGRCSYEVASERRECGWATRQWTLALASSRLRLRPHGERLPEVGGGVVLGRWPDREQGERSQPRAALTCFTNAAVLASCAFPAPPSSSPRIPVASSFPSSTPHWSNELMFHIQPWTKIRCS